MRNKILQWVPLAVLLIAWEAYAKFQSGFSTMFSSPVRIITLLYEKTVSGDLPYHTFITAYESFVGLLFGLFIGCIIGFILVYFPKCSKIAHPYIIALSSIPTFALAPLMIIWFGTGLKMKIVLAFLSTVFITAFQTYEGAVIKSLKVTILFSKSIMLPTNNAFGCSHSQPHWIGLSNHSN